MTSPSVLQSYDTWILVALLHATEKQSSASLSELIKAADAVNHAIITHGELETGLSRLVTLGHVTFGPSGFAPSSQIREFWNTKTRSWRSVFKSWEKLGTYIGAAATDSGPLPEPETEIYLTKAAYASAIENYKGSVPHPFIQKQ